MAIKKGQVFYSCWPFTNDNGRVEITVDEWVVRSIQRKRNSQSQYGIPKLYRDDTVYVNLSQRWEGVTCRKGVWDKSIPDCCRRQFVLNNGLPHNLFTTPLQALKFALTVAETDAETRAVKTRITKLRNQKKAKR